MKLYTSLCAIVLTLLSALLITRKDVDVTIMRTPGQLYQDKGKDSVSNLYNIKVVNKTMKPIPLTVKLDDINGTIETIGNAYIEVAKEGQGSGSIFVVLAKKDIHHKKAEIKLSFYQGNTKICDSKTNFLGPVAE
jgi:hypothetical protein